jgi:hypothetical protein
MTTHSEDPQNGADLRGPGDPDEAAAQRAGQPGPEAGRAANIREEQQTQAAGVVPASYVGSGDPEVGHKPEDAVHEPGTWDDEV